MPPRIRLHEKLVSILGTKYVYFQAPENMKLQYPCIVYELADINGVSANDSVYLLRKQYQVTLIDGDPDSSIIDKIAAIPKCRFNRHYTANNLNHYVFYLYF